MSQYRHPRLERDLSNLSRAFALCIGDDFDFVIVQGLKLPPGYNRSTTDLLVELPADYPVSPPGLGNSKAYLSPDLRFRNRRLKDLHEWQMPDFTIPGFGPWAWFCYERIEWWPERDDLIKFVEMVRADLARTKTTSFLNFL